MGELEGECFELNTMRSELLKQARARLGRRNPKAYWWALRCTKETSPYPLQAKIETTTKCNLQCLSCWRTNMPKDVAVDGWACHTLPGMVNRDMSMSDFRHILDELAGVALISLHGWGEPLIHPQFLEQMREVHQRDLTNHLVTNGLLLDSRTSESLMSECPPVKITFSVDGGTQDAYEKIRVGGRFDILVENVRGIVEARNRLSPTTQIDFYCTLGVHNLNQIEPISELACSLGVDHVTFSDLTLYDVGVADADHAIRVQNVSNEVYARVARLNEKFGKSTHVTFTGQKEVGCDLVWTQVLVQVNGDASTCGCDPARGNIFRTPLKKLWNSSEWCKFRRQMVEDSLPKWYGCDTCILHRRNGINW